MKHGAVRRLMRVATLSLLALGMTSGVASAAVWSASPAMAQSDDQNGNADGNTSGNQSGAQSGDQKPNGSGGLLDNLGGLTGGGKPA